MTEKELVAMGLHDIEIVFASDTEQTDVRRVAGGWIYTTRYMTYSDGSDLSATGVFVPERN